MREDGRHVRSLFRVRYALKHDLGTLTPEEVA